MSEKWTAGPWEHGIEGVNQHCIVAPATGRIVARADFSKNRDLIAAAPRMIQAVLGHRSMSASLHYSQGADRKRAAAAAVHLLETEREKRKARD